MTLHTAHDITQEQMDQLGLPKHAVGFELYARSGHLTTARCEFEVHQEGFDGFVSSIKDYHLIERAPEGYEYKLQPVREGRGNWMQTVSGRQFWPYDPRSTDVDIYDIAVGLSNECRYAGQVEHHYSVAQHSVYVSLLVPRRHALSALLHDAPEAYCKDIHQPLKTDLHGYAEIEDKIWRAVAEKFCLPYEMDESIHEADKAMSVAEKEQILTPCVVPWTLRVAPAPVRIRVMTPYQARVFFMERFKDLTA